MFNHRPRHPSLWWGEEVIAATRGYYRPEILLPFPFPELDFLFSIYMLQLGNPNVGQNNLKHYLLGFEVYLRTRFPLRVLQYVDLQDALTRLFGDQLRDAYLGGRLPPPDPLAVWLNAHQVSPEVILIFFRMRRYPRNEQERTRSFEATLEAAILENAAIIQAAQANQAIQAPSERQEPVQEEVEFLGFNDGIIVPGQPGYRPQGGAWGDWNEIGGWGGGQDLVPYRNHFSMKSCGHSQLLEVFYPLTQVLSPFFDLVEPILYWLSDLTFPFGGTILSWLLKREELSRVVVWFARQLSLGFSWLTSQKEKDA